MNVTISYTLDGCNANISPDASLTEVAFAVESAASHFIGRGVNRFECVRSRTPAGFCQLDFKALKKSGPMQISKVGAIGYSVREGLFPATIPAGEKFQVEETGFEKVLAEGQHRHGKMPSVVGSKSEASHTTSIVESHDLNPELPLTVLTYGLGDLFTGLFALNVRYCKWQGSLKMVQLYIRHNLSDKQLASFLLSNQDYDIRRKVSTLS